MRGSRTKKAKTSTPAPAHAKTKFGRPTKLTPETQEKILASIRAGNYTEVAAAYAGISKTTFYGWIHKGEARAAEIAAAIKEAEENSTEPVFREDAEGDLYYNFLNAVEQASAESEVHDMTLIGVAAARNWRAAAWRLEHKYPSRYGRQVVEVSGLNGGAIPMEINLSNLSEEELETLERLLLKAKPSSDASGESAGTNQGGEKTS